jgi:molybdopterin-biosynthesis enzyme MoeA-like protein
MAGIPAVMQAMLQELAPRLTHGAPMRSAAVTIRAGEGDIAAGLAAIQQAQPRVVIGSYPFQANDGFAAEIVLRSRDEAALAAAEAEVRVLAQSLVAQGKARGFS